MGTTGLSYQKNCSRRGHPVVPRVCHHHAGKKALTPGTPPWVARGKGAWLAGRGVARRDCRAGARRAVRALRGVASGRGRGARREDGAVSADEGGSRSGGGGGGAVAAVSAGPWSPRPARRVASPSRAGTPAEGSAVNLPRAARPLPRSPAPREGRPAARHPV